MNSVHEHSKQADRKTSWTKYVWVFGVIFAFLFVLLIWALGPNLKHFTDTLIQRNDLSWYYWKLPTRNFWGMAITWALYLANQLAIWLIIYFAQTNKYGFRDVDRHRLLKYTLAALSITVTFVFLHLIQTHLLFASLSHRCLMNAQRLSLDLQPPQGCFLLWPVIV